MTATCPICGGVSRLLFRRGEKSFHQCGHCHLVFQDPLPSAKEEREYYKQCPLTVERSERFRRSRKILFESFLRYLHTFQTSGTLLDVGCQLGDFLLLARQQGWEVKGVDVSEEAVRIAKEEHELEVLPETLEEARFPDAAFDVVTFWMVLDQLTEPQQTIREAFRILKPGGLLFLRLPNVQFHMGVRRFYHLFGGLLRRFGLEEPAIFHSYGFSPKSLRFLLGQAGFEKIEMANSPLSPGDPYETLMHLPEGWVSVLKKTYSKFCEVLYWMSAKKIFANASFLTKASRPPSKKKVSVAHIITRLDRGGSAENTLLTATRLDKARYEVTLIYGETLEGMEGAIEKARKEGVRILYLKELVRNLHPWADLVAFLKLYTILRREKFDIVHTHSSKAGALGRLAASLAGAKRIVHAPHGHVFYGYFNPLFSRLILWIERFLGKRTDRLITLTHRGKEEHAALRIMPEAKIVPVYSGIRLEDFRNFVPSRIPPFGFRDAPKGPRIGILSRLVPIKGHQVLLNAVPSVIREVPDACFFLAGDGPLRKALEKQCETLKILSSVFFLGDLEDVRDFLYEMDLLVLPSLNEGMGRVLLEAQAMGKPVIGTRVGGIPEVIQEGRTGWVVPPRDSNALARAMLFLLKDPERCKEMGKAAQAWIDEKFSIETMVSKISGVYEELLKSP